MIRALIVILVYIVGPVAILLWAIKRYRYGNKPSLGEVSAVIIAIAMMVTFSYFMYWKVGDHGNEKVAQIVSELIKSYDFPVKAKFQDRPAVVGISRP
ncbi:MAG: hypothetical protein R3240_13460, partial [Gammaproteobacteria bacterium]|nr:hypothetical protein [Gammaproteobacteria bacterium]